MNSKLSLFVIAGLITSSFYAGNAFAESGNSEEGQIRWSETTYPADGTAVVQVIDSDMNLDPETVDIFHVDVWSDSDFAGTTITLTETDGSTGVFEGTVFFTTTDYSSGHRLRVMEGETIYSRYEDTTLPKSHATDKLFTIGTASIQGNPSSSTDSKIILDKTSYAWDDNVGITISAPGYNFDGNAVEILDESNNQVKIVIRHLEYDDFLLTETGTDTGVFVGEINLDGTGSYPGYGKSDGISVFFEFEDDKVAVGSAQIIGKGFPGFKITTFGIFDAKNDGNLVNQLYVGQTYRFNLEYQNQLEKTQIIGDVVHLIDKNKTEDNIFKKGEGRSTQKPSAMSNSNYNIIPEYPGHFEYTVKIFSKHYPIVGTVTSHYDFVVIEKLSLKQQIERKIPINGITCENKDHNLILRTNGKLACVNVSTAEKFGWKFV